MRTRRGAEGWEGIRSQPPPLNPSSKSLCRGVITTLSTNFAATLPLQRSAVLSRQREVERASTSLGQRWKLQREVQNVRDDDTSGLRPISRGVELVVPRKRAPNYEERHMQLLHEEREQHRLEMDRFHQRLHLLKLRGDQEREAHMATTRLLFAAQLETREVREEAARCAIVAAEVEDFLCLSQLFARGRCYKTGNNACHSSMQTVPNTLPCIQPVMLNAHDSDLLQALFRAEARVVHLEKSHYNRAPPHNEKTAEWSPLHNRVEQGRTSAFSATALAAPGSPSVADIASTAASIITAPSYTLLGPRISISSSFA